MFDLIAIGRQSALKGTRAVPTMISIVGHTVVVVGLTAFSLFFASERLPHVQAMMAFVASAPAPPPPPPPPPPPAAGPRQAPAAKPTETASPGQPAFPLSAPSEVLPEPVRSQESFGVEGGVEGGIIGGTLGGIVGGLVAAAPPPPPPPPPPQPKAVTPVRVGGLLETPALVYRVEPVYPQIAVVSKVTGMVILEAVVDVDGSVRSVNVLRSIKLLDQAAIEAVKQWRYRPLMLNGIATPFVLTVTVNFGFAKPPQ